jgi:hypothetical protein
MSGPKENYIISKMSTVLVINMDGKDLKQEEDKINKKVEKIVKEIIDQLKTNHSKFEDPDFGPRTDDEYGAVSLYGGKVPEPAGSKYPAPESLRWERPMYTDDKFDTGKDGEGNEENGDDDEEEEDDDDFGFGGGRGDDKEMFCENGRLFIDGSSSGDVIQGQLGDCWFLSALAVIGADDTLLENCFWRREEFREYGLYVLRFYKDCSVFFVIIDDRLPVKDKDGRLIFAGGKDPNELWVPLIEKAYGKLHGCYKALIGGYTHYGLADMTGFSPRLIVMREGYLGFSQKYEPNDLWALLQRYSSWKSMMGCSIQPAPNDKRKVEAEAGQGLHMGHAYSFLGLGEIKDKKTGAAIRLVKLRNPWGRGEWEGRFSDNSPERVENDSEIARVFDSQVKKVEKSTIDHADGTFFMPYDDWLQHYTSLFIAINFPSPWIGRRVGGIWSGEQGGNRDMGTWITNPKFKLRIEAPSESQYKPVFVGLYIKDSRLTLGFDYYKDPLYATPLTFDIVTAADLSCSNATQKTIPKAVRFFPIPANQKPEPCLQPPYNFGAAQVEVFLQPNEDYYIIPSLYKRNQPGEFFLTVYAECDKLHLDGSSLVSETHKPMQVADGKVTLKMSVAQFNEKKESLRDRIISEAKRLNISYVQIRNLLLNNNQETLSRSVFKRRMVDAGFMLTDFPDDDFVVLDGDTGQIKINDFLDFIAKGLSFEEGVSSLGPPPSKPVDDLLFKAIDLSGELRVHVNSARGLRDASAWFKNLPAAPGTAPNSSDSGDAGASRPRTLITYDVEKAATARQRAIKARAVPPSVRFPSEEAADSTLTTGISSTGKPATGAAMSTNPTELSINIDFEAISSVPGSPIRTLASLQNNPNGKAAPTGHKAMSVASQMSMTQKDIISKAGASAAVKLHSDALLQRAEVSRTKNLSLLRANGLTRTGSDSTGKPASSDKKNEEEITIMRAKSSTTAGKKERRNIRQHVDVMLWLGIPLESDNVGGRLTARQDFGSSSAPPVGSLLPTRAGMNTSNPSTSAKKTATIVPVSASTANAAASMTVRSNAATGNIVTDKVQQASPPPVAVNKGRSQDIWDLLIDNVYTICSSRPVNSRTQRHRTFMEMKRKPIRAEQLQLLDDAFTPLPVPSKANQGKVSTLGGVAGQVNKLVVGTPRMKLISRGVASVKSAHVSKSQTKQTIVEARDKLVQLQQSMGKTYYEVYRRLVSITTTSYEEMSGERASKAQVSLAANSTAYLKKLFEKFDTNGNGLISKEEFRLAMLDLNVELSREDCDIFFNRFTGTVPGNINWKEFVDFFQHEIAGSTMKTFSGSSSTNSNAAANSKVGLDMNIVCMLMDVKRVVKDAVQRMQQQRITSIDAYLEANRMQSNGSTAPTAAVLNSARQNQQQAPQKAPATGDAKSTVGLIRAKKNFSEETVIKIPPNAIFQTLALAQVKSNTSNLQALGLININEVMVARISRIFDFSVSNLMDFILNEPEVSTLAASTQETNPDAHHGTVNLSDLSVVLNEFDEVLTKELLARGGSFAFGGKKSAPIGAAVSANADNASTIPPPLSADSKKLSSTPAKPVGINGTPNLSKSASQATVPVLLINNSASVSVLPPAPPAISSSSSAGAVDFVDPPHSTTAKIWSTFAPTLDALSPFEVIVRYLFSLLQECQDFTEKEITLVSPRAVKDPMVRGVERKASMPVSGATAAIPSATSSANPSTGSVESTILTGKKLFFRGTDVSVLVRIVVDAMVYSSWNRLPANSIATGASGGGLGNGNGNGMLSGAGNGSANGGLSGGNGGAGGALSAGAGSKTGNGAGGSSDSSVTLVGFLSYSGLDAYIRNNRIAYIERKLQYLIHLEHDRNKSDTFFLVHVFLSNDGNELVILADDPLSGSVHKLQLSENVCALPSGEALRALFMQNKALENAIQVAGKLLPNRPFDQDSLFLYNPIDTPVEDLAISQMVGRLKLIRSHATNSSQLILAEDPLLVQQIKNLMDASAKSLPFFYLVNDLYLSFEVDEMAIKSMQELQELNNPGQKALTNGKSSANDKGNSVSKSSERVPSVRSVVFGSIRSQKGLATFLTQVKSSLKVVLTTYNSTLRETFEWDEMLAHLSNKRNPFVTVQLLPKYIPPEKYLYEPQDQAKAFTGDDDDDSDDEPEPPSEAAEEGIELPRHKSWQRSRVEFDGAPRPVWDENFAFNFHSPKMTSCEVHAREVVKMKIDSVTKYVMILIREGLRPKLASSDSTGSDSTNDKENFFFLTLYDPRSATEYQVGVKPQSPLYAHLYYDRSKPQLADYKNIDILRDKLNQASEKDDIFVGPAITPRIQLSVFNHKDGKMKELIGQSQVSVSSVLSGSGVSDRVWVKLINTVEKPSAVDSNASKANSTKKPLPIGEVQLVEEPAGEIEVELRFRRSIEMIGEMKAKQAAKQAGKRRNSSQLGSHLGPGDQGGNYGASSDVVSKRTMASSGGGSNKDAAKVKELNQLLASTEEKLKRAESEYTKLFSSVNNKNSPAGTAATTTANGKPLEQYVAQLENEKQALVAEKTNLDAEKEKWQREHAAVMAELHKLEEQVGASDGKGNHTAAGASTASPRGKLSDAKALAEVQELQQTNQQLIEQDKASKKALEDLRQQLHRMKEEHAKTVEEVYRLQDAMTTTTTTTTTKPGKAGGPVTSSAVVAASHEDASAMPAMNLSHILQILLTRYERKLKATGMTNAPVTAGAILDTLQRLLHSFANPEGMITQRELMVAFSELMIDVHTELVVKVIADVGPDARKMVQVHSVMDYFKRELGQMLKLQQRKLRESLRTSQEGPVLSAKAAAATATAADTEPTTDTKHKPRPVSAVVQGSGKAAVAGMKSDAHVADAGGDGKPVRATKDLRSQSAKSIPTENNSHNSLNSHDPGHLLADNTKTTSGSAAADSEYWNTQPLPPKWERKFHAPANRVCSTYIVK